jgi:hypothetical protein
MQVFNMKLPLPPQKKLAKSWRPATSQNHDPQRSVHPLNF